MKPKVPSKKTQEMIQNACRTLVQLSRSKMSEQYDQWRRNEEEFKAYTPETLEDAIRRDKRDSGKPQYTTIVVPFSYAIAMTAHTYYTSVFLARNPVFQYAGRHGEGEMQTQAVESLIDYQLTVGENMVPLFLWLFDPVKYGVGWLGHYWDREVVQTRTRERKPVTWMGIPTGKFEWVDTVRDIPAYEGHRLFNIRPQDAFPDPRVSMWNFQKGEFFARYVEIPAMEVRRNVRDGTYFNVEKLRQQAMSADRDVGSSAVTHLPDAGENDYMFAYGELPPFIKAYEVYIRINPREWGLDTVDREEMWLFLVAADSYLPFCAQPVGLYHGKFPVDVLQQEPEAYSLYARSMIEVMQPLSEAITWLVNSHMYNVRAVLNNQFVYDPSMLVSKDLENPSPGKLIRMKPAAMGRDVRTMIAQLPVADVTQGHLPNMQLMADMLQRVTGVTDNIMGMVNPGGRKTATEVRQSTSFGVNRLKTTCEYFSSMGFAPLAMKLLQGTQQFYNDEKQYRVVGDVAQFSPGFVNVSPDSIAGFYDFVPVDGTMPVDRFAQANLWQMLLGQMSKVPQVMQTYDIAKMFGWVAQLAGLKNIQQFRVQVAPPGVAPGGMPVDHAGFDFGRPPNQMQIPGMGATA